MTKKFGKSFHNINDFKNIQGSNIGTTKDKVEEMTIPKKYALTLKKAALKEKKEQIAFYKDQGLELPPHLKKKKEDKKRFPAQEPVPDPKPISVIQALHQSDGWRTSNIVSKKFATGTVSTAKYNEKTSNFARMNELADEMGTLYPQSAYYGGKPNPDADPFDKRVVKQLNDIDFEESTDEEEEIKNLKRMPRTILNEENFKESVTEEVERLVLENHYWLKNNVLSKIGRMAPNL